MDDLYCFYKILEGLALNSISFLKATLNLSSLRKVSWRLLPIKQLLYQNFALCQKWKNLKGLYFSLNNHRLSVRFSPKFSHLNRISVIHPCTSCLSFRPWYHFRPRCKINLTRPTLLFLKREVETGMIKQIISKICFVILDDIIKLVLAGAILYRVRTCSRRKLLHPVSHEVNMFR